MPFSVLLVHTQVSLRLLTPDVFQATNGGSFFLGDIKGKGTVAAAGGWGQSTVR